MCTMTVVMPVLHAQDTYGQPEAPLVAYRAFLEEQQRQSAFRILDKSLETEFWKYYANDSIHSFYPTGSKEASQSFTTLWWLLETPP